MDISLIGSQIQKFRKQQGLTQKELGAAIGVSTQAVSQWENGGAPDVSLLPAIADKLGVTVDALFGRESGEVRDMTGTLAAWLRSRPGTERMQDLSRLLWEACMRSYKEINVPKIEYPKECEQTLNGARCLMRTVIGSEDGFTLGVAGEDMSYMCVFPEPAEGYGRYLLDDDAYRKLFATLALPGALELIRYLYQEKEYYYIVAPAAAKRVGISAEEAQRVLEALAETRLIIRTELELEEGVVPAYMLQDADALIPFLQFARWLGQRDGLYFVNMNLRERPSLKAKEKKDHEKD